MSRKVKPKGAKRLMDLLGVDPLAPVPSNLEEARMMQEMDGGDPVRRSSGYRLDNDCMKVCFTSEAACKDAIKYRLRVGSNVSRLRAYFCEDCAAWHMTSSFHS